MAKRNATMNNQQEMVIKRLEAIVAELECEFLYLINDICQDSSAETEKLRNLVANLRLARHFLGVAASEARSGAALAVAS